MAGKELDPTQLKALQAEARRAEQRVREAERRQRHQALVASRQLKAQRRTAAVEKRVAALRSILLDGLRWPAEVEFGQLRRVVDVAPVDLGDLDQPIRPKGWELFAPPPPGRLARLVGARSRHEFLLQQRRTDYERHLVECADRERERKRRLTRRRADHQAAVERATAEVERHNAGLAHLERQVGERDEVAVRTYLAGALQQLPLPDILPRGAEVAVRSGAGEVEVRPALPSLDSIPKVQRYTVSAQTALETAVPLDASALHRDVVGQIVLLGLRCVFGSVAFVEVVRIHDGRDMLRVLRSAFPPDQQLRDVDAAAFLDRFRP